MKFSFPVLSVLVFWNNLCFKYVLVSYLKYHVVEIRYRVERIWASTTSLILFQSGTDWSRHRHSSNSRHRRQWISTGPTWHSRRKLTITCEPCRRKRETCERRWRHWGDSLRRKPSPYEKTSKTLSWESEQRCSLRTATIGDKATKNE